MKNIMWLAIAAVAVVAVAGAAVLLTGDNGNDTVIEEPEPFDPAKETSDAKGRLWIVGNANMDDVLDENDIIWIQKILDKKANEVIFNTGLEGGVDVRMADANQDGKVDSADIDKVRSMINAKPGDPKQEIYYVDVDGLVSMMHYPAKTMISTYEQNTKQVQTIHALDDIVACDHQSAGHVETGGVLNDKIIFNSYGERKDPKAEVVLQHPADLILTGTRDIYCQTLEGALPANRTNLDLIRISSWEDGNVIAGTLTLGFMIQKNTEALAYAQWATGWIDTIQSKVSQLSPDDIVKVLVPRGQMSDWNISMNGPGSGKYETSVLAGANNIATLPSTGKVSDEWVKEQSDLDFIVAIVYEGFDVGHLTSGFTNKSFYDTAVEYWSGMTSAYGTQVHVVDNLVSQGTSFVIGAVYMAKWFYPELFADMNPDAIFQEFCDDFLQYDIDVAEFQANGGIAI